MGGQRNREEKTGCGVRSSRAIIRRRSARTAGETMSGSCRIVDLATLSLNISCRISGLSLSWLPTLMVNLIVAKKMTDPVRADERRPKQPDLFWFGHGLWDLPNMGATRPHNLTCADCFATVVSTLKQLQASNKTQVVWQTNYPIEMHPHVRNEYLEWEIQCQREIARVNGIPLFDMANFMTDATEPISDDGYHISTSIAYGVASVLDAIARGQPESAQDMHTKNVSNVTLALDVYAASELKRRLDEDSR